MSPTPRRVKKSEPPTQKRRDRALAIIGLVVVASMFLTLVISPGTVQERPQTPSLPTQGPPSAQDLLATIVAQETVSAAIDATAQPAQATRAAASGTLTPTVAVSGTVSATRAPTAIATP